VAYLGLHPDDAAAADDSSVNSNTMQRHYYINQCLDILSGTISDGWLLAASVRLQRQASHFD
jgi:hypothetical protein